MEPLVISAETPSRREFASPAPPVHDEPPTMRPSAEAQYVAEADETQHFNVPLVEKVTHQAHQPSTSRNEAPLDPAAPQTGPSAFKAVWDRLEEIAVAGAAVGGGAHLISHAQESALLSVAPPPAEPEVASRIEIPVNAPPEPPANLVDEVTRKVLAQLRPAFIEQISRELIRPIIEAIVRRELEKK